MKKRSPVFEADGSVGTRRSERAEVLLAGFNSQAAQMRAAENLKVSLIDV